MCQVFRVDSRFVLFQRFKLVLPSFQYWSVFRQYYYYLVLSLISYSSFKVLYSYYQGFFNITYVSFGNSLIQYYVLIYLFVEAFLFIVTSLLVPLLVQLYERIRFVFKEVSSRYYFVVSFYISFFESRQDIYTLLLLQFYKPFYSQYACSRPIYNLSYRQLFAQISPFRVTSFTLLYFNSFTKFFLVFSQFTPSIQALQAFELLYYSVDYLT